MCVSSFKAPVRGAFHFSIMAHFLVTIYADKKNHYSLPQKVYRIEASNAGLAGYRAFKHYRRDHPKTRFGDVRTHTSQI